jgi:Xaa-Pro aminopeptidase
VGAPALSLSAAVSHYSRAVKFDFRMKGRPALSGRDRLPADWYGRKLSHLQHQLEAHKLDALLLGRASNVIYTTGYFHRTTERPLLVFIPCDADPVMFIPAVERDQIRQWWRGDVEVYFDYPGTIDPLEWACGEIAKRGYRRKRIGVEDISATLHMRMARALPHAEIIPGTDGMVSRMRYVKDASELALMQRAMEFADFTVSAARDFIQRHGRVTEDEILRASADATAEKLARELADVVGVSIEPPFAGMVPFGRRSAYPHALPDRSRSLQRGDPLILSFGSQIGGYNVECERSFVVGNPDDRARRMFDAMLAAHDAAVSALKQGAVAEEIDRKAQDLIRNAGMADCLRHRTGHGIGLEAHEPPWISAGDRTVLLNGMTLCVEPGVYDPQFGGFRHSDTVVVHSDGAQVMNRYPTRLEDMVIRI